MENTITMDFMCQRSPMHSVGVEGEPLGYSTDSVNDWASAVLYCMYHMYLTHTKLVDPVRGDLKRLRVGLSVRSVGESA
jgi:hypothetical protein